MENILARRIETAGQKSAYDKYCKRLLANKQILARILKVCVVEFSECTLKDIEEKYIEGTPEVSEAYVHQDEGGEFIQGMNTEDATMTEGNVYYDIRFWVVSPKNGEHIRMLVNVESQNNFFPGYPLVKRAMYYCSRLISGQYGTEFQEEHYEQIKKVYSIWVCTNPSKSHRNTITRYSVEESNLIGTVAEKRENYDLLTVLMVCLGGQDGEHYEGLLKMLDVLLSAELPPLAKKDILQSEFDITFTKSMESEVLNNMCNLSQGIEDKVTIKHLINLMNSSGWSEEKCMDSLGIPEEQQRIYHLILEDERSEPASV